MVGQCNQHSKATQAIRRFLVDKLLWFLRQRGYKQCGLPELRQFLACSHSDHEEPGGRWGNAHMTRPVRPRTIHTYHGHLQTMFSWIVEEGALEASLMERIEPPVARRNQVKPFVQEEIERLLEAARRSHNPRRNEAITSLLYDTGIRASAFYLSGKEYYTITVTVSHCQ